MILFGFKGSGKSHFGKLLAKELSLPFIDTDELIENVYLQRFHAPLTCRQIALEKGHPFFRNLEKESIHSLEHKRAIIAVGGGAILDSENSAFLQKLGILVYLHAKKEMIKKRMLSGILPSYIDAETPEDSFESMYQERIVKYGAIPAIKVEMEEKTEREILDTLLEVYGK